MRTENQEKLMHWLVGIAVFVIVGCMIWSGTVQMASMSAYCDKVGGRMEQYQKGYSYTQNKDGSGSGETEYGYQIRLPDGSVITDLELGRRGLIKYW